MLVTLFTLVFRACLTAAAVLLSLSVFLAYRVPDVSVAWSRMPVELTQPSNAVTHLREFLRFQTVCQPGATLNVGDRRTTFDAAKGYLLTTYRDLFDRDDVTVDEVNELSLLVEWKGSNPALQPVMLYGHYDVVPVSNKTLPFWTHDPFEGVLEDGFVWGRGTVDMKGSLVAMLEALTHLHRAGYAPRRPLLLAIGHDEEVGGVHGAAAIAAELRRRGTAVDVLLDEGTPVFVDGLAPLVRQPVALVGTAEKGCAAFKIEVSTAGGHSSMPPIDGSHTGRVMADVIRAIDARQPPVALQPPMTDMLRNAAPHAPFLLRGWLHFADVWPVSSVLGHLWARLSAATAAQVRSTAVPTLLGMGIAQNVVPQHGDLTVDMRLLQGHGGGAPLEYLEGTLRAAGLSHAARVSRIAGIFGGEDGVPPSAVASADGKWWDLLVRAIQQSLEPLDSVGSPINASMPVLPSILTGGTDSKHLGALSDNGVFRFLPLSMNRTAGDLGLVHGIDERVRPEAFLAAIKFYVRVVQLFTSTA